MGELLRDVANFLIQNGKFTAINTDVFLDTKPDKPEELCSLFEYTGSEAGPGMELLNRRVQVLVRAATYPQAKAKAWEIYKLLGNPDPEEILEFPGGRIAVVSPLQTPFKMETDDKKRTEFVCNYNFLTHSD